MYCHHYHQHHRHHRPPPSLCRSAVFHSSHSPSSCVFITFFLPPSLSSAFSRCVCVCVSMPCFLASFWYPSSAAPFPLYFFPFVLRASQCKCRVALGMRVRRRCPRRSCPSRRLRCWQGLSDDRNLPISLSVSDPLWDDMVPLSPNPHTPPPTPTPHPPSCGCRGFIAEVLKHCLGVPEGQALLCKEPRSSL